MDASLIVRRSVFYLETGLFTKYILDSVTRRCFPFTRDSVIFRHPAQWLLLPEEDANCIWLMTGTPHGAQPESMMVEGSSIPKVSVVHSA